MTRRGVSLVEVLAIIGILLVIIALAMPAISQSKEVSKQKNCQSNLRQLHVSLSLYRQDYGGDGVFGDAYAMGLPPIFASSKLPLLKTLKCAAAGNALFPTKGVHYYTFWVDPHLDGLHPKWRDYAMEFQQDSILFSDVNHNPGISPLSESPYVTRLGLGIVENGSLVRKRKKGDWMHKPWWNTP